MDRKRSESGERGGGPEREGRRAVSGGKRAQLMMKEGHVGVRARPCVFITGASTTCACTRRGGEGGSRAGEVREEGGRGGRRGGGAESTSEERVIAIANTQK